MSINAAEKANRFASKRAAHSVPEEPVSTTFSDLDEAIDTLKKLAEKYTRLILAERREELEPLHRASLLIAVVVNAGNASADGNPNSCLSRFPWRSIDYHTLLVTF